MMSQQQQQQPMPHVRVRRGFSIAELTVVLVITGILAAMAIPRFSNSLALRRVEGAARRVAADLAMAQRYAKATSTSQTVAFKPLLATYMMATIPDISRRFPNYEVRLAEEPYRVTMISADFGGDADLVFDGFGVPDSGGSVILRSGHHTRTITVDADTGKASVQ